MAISEPDLTSQGSGPPTPPSYDRWRKPGTERDTDRAKAAYRRLRTEHWDRVARRVIHGPDFSSAYHRRITKIYQSIVPPGHRVLEVGCGRGDLLAGLRPAYGFGADFSAEMLRRAQRSHPELHFINADVATLQLTDKFDFIVLSDLVNDLWDVEEAFHRLLPLTHSGTRVILNFYSRVWEPALGVARRLGAAKPLLVQNWLTVDDVSNLLRLADFELMRHWEEILVPVQLPGIETVANRYLAHIWPLRIATLSHFVVARPASLRTDKTEPLVSVIVPARNESGNIDAIFSRTPEMGRGTELVFVEGHSEDDTYATIAREIQQHSDRSARLLKQTGKGKGDAVRLGFEHARGEVLMILDADLTVAPEDLPRFYNALVSGKGEFINGVRLVYPMERQAMRFFNLLGNKFFSLAFTWLLGQPIKDTLCGTKALYKGEYERIVQNRAYFGDFDPFGDFDLLFGAAKLNLKIVDMPIRYRDRTYGSTNISRWRHGLLLLRMTLFAARRIRFV